MIMDVMESQGRDEQVPVPGKGQIGSSSHHGEIYLLTNHVQYYLQYVFILVERTGYRLVVIHDGLVKTNKCYASLRGAKIAFARMYNRKAWKKGVEPEWGPPHKPSGDWLENKIEILKRYSQGLWIY